MTDSGRWIVPHKVTGIDQVTLTNQLDKPVLYFEAHRASILGFEFGLIPAGDARNETSWDTAVPNVLVSGREVVGPASSLTVECSIETFDGGIFYACHVNRVVELSALTITIEWSTQNLAPTDIPIDMGALNEAIRLSENPPAHTPPGYTAPGR